MQKLPKKWPLGTFIHKKECFKIAQKVANIWALFVVKFVVIVLQKAQSDHTAPFMPRFRADSIWNAIASIKSIKNNFFFLWTEDKHESNYED